ncbi:hypothetical protein RB599_003698 [Gaeumannomyces hyphopodioides]
MASERSTTLASSYSMAGMELFHIEVDMASLLNHMSDEDLHSFAESQEDPASDEQIELYIYACFLVFKRSASTEHLERAVQRAEGWVAVTPPDHPDRTRRFQMFNMMSAWARQHRSMLENIVPTPLGVNQDATFGDIGIQIYHLSRQAARLAKNYKQTRRFEDMEEAIRIMEWAVDIGGGSIQPDILNNLGAMLGMRFQLTKSMDDINRAVKVADMAVDATPQNHPDRASRLSNLGNWLGMRFERTGSMDDIDRAVEVANTAVNATPQNHPDRAACLNNLGNKLNRRFERTGSMGDINRAVEVADMAVDATPQNHPDRAGRLSNFGSLLGRRFERIKSMGDINRAVEVADMAVDATPQNHPDRAGRLNNLGNLLSSRFERTGSMDDINRAVEVAGMAVNATPQNHPNRAVCSSNFGNWLGRRFERTGSVDDLNRSLSSYKEGWVCHTAPPSIRIRLARDAANILASQRNWDESSQLLQEAVELLPTVSPRSLNHTDKQHMLANFAGLASMAAATALNAGKEASHALQLLELGRGVIAGLLMDMRGDISDLKRKHPSLADEFVVFRDALDSSADRPTSANSNDNTSSWESRARRRREADQKFSELIKIIRDQPGFNGFLRTPTADNLMAAANPDPIIVVNLSRYRCDAFLVERDRIRVLELPGLTMGEVQKRAQDFRLSRSTGSFHISSLLEWLWDAAAGPCLNALGFKDPVFNDNWPRVWWIPTGLLSQLPLHAAGKHVRGSTETVLDRVMSSYTPSVKALIHGRQRPVRGSAKPFSNCALLVAMRETPNLSGNRILPFAANEVEMLKNLCRELRLWSLTPILRKDNVLKHLQTCKIFHFAGHGQSDPAEPSRSCLLLEDWKTSPLTVGDLRDHKLQENGPFLGYLSACSTGANEAVQLADEGIHLVSAFQLAGFRHVVGTLWEVSDKYCVDVARVLYETLRDEGMTDAAVCRGLHRAVRALRDGRVEKKREIEKEGEVKEEGEIEKEGVVKKEGEARKRERKGHYINPGLAEKGEAGKGSYADPGVAKKGFMSSYWIPYVHFGV